MHEINDDSPAPLTSKTLSFLNTPSELSNEISDFSNIVSVFTIVKASKFNLEDLASIILIVEFDNSTFSKDIKESTGR